MYQLIYWPMIQGRGEFPRLVLECAAAPYDDVARTHDDGMTLVQSRLYGAGNVPGFAPPYLVDGDVELAQTAVICAYLGERHELAPTDPVGRMRALQLMLSITDVVNEAHDVHHPLGVSLYYEDQKSEAARRAGEFRDRLGTWLSFFERVIDATGDRFCTGPSMTYVDLALFQLVEGLRYALPQTTAQTLANASHVPRVCDAVRAHPKVADYLTSNRRIPFNEDGIFRHYPELDADSSEARPR